MLIAKKIKGKDHGSFKVFFLCRSGSWSAIFAVRVGLGWGTVSYTDGSPAAGAQVIVTGGGQGKTVVICDAEGHFEIGSIPDGVMVRIKTKDKDYAPLKLPASLLSAGNVAIVLQPKVTKSKSLQ